MSAYCWMFGEHKGDPCLCGWSSKTDEIAVLKRQNEGLRDALKIDDAEIVRLQKQVKRQELVLKMYANKDNWKSINGLMVLQTLSHPWADAEFALKGGDHA